jgi:hypothetical protein
MRKAWKFITTSRFSWLDLAILWAIGSTVELLLR